ncbi:MAG: hypothetical protein ABI771_02310 [Betaproteobacteria bacterium]
MLKWIKGADDEHPLADDKAAREYIEQLPALDSYKSLDELSNLLHTLGGATRLKAARVLEIIDLVDAAAKTHHRKLAQDYLAGSARLQKVREVRIWNAVVGFWKELADAYAMCADRCQDGSGGWSALKARMPMVVSRALRAMAVQLKWHLVRYGPVEPGYWAKTGKLFAYAEEQGFTNSAVEVYPGNAGTSTVQREFLKVAMLAVSSPGSLAPLNLEIAQRVVGHLSEYFEVHADAAPDCHFHVYVDADTPPARAMSVPVEAPGRRMFGPGQAVAELDRLIAAVQGSGFLPTRVDLGGAFDTQVVLSAMHHLARYWAPVPPARSEERHGGLARISVVYDFTAISTMVSNQTNSSPFDDAIEVWTAENESESGYGALVPFTKSDWLRVGTLLGIKREEGASWGVGVVRRIAAFDHTQRHIGIQMLTRGAIAVNLMEDSLVADSQVLPVDSALLLLSHAPDSGGAANMNLLLKPGIFAPANSMQMRIWERDYVLMSGEIVESGEDFDLARYRVMQRSE